MYQHVWIQIVEAKDLKEADSSSLPDPYVTLTRSSEQGKKLGALKAPVLKKTLNPKWYSEFVFNGLCAPMETLHIRVYDRNRFPSGKLIGQTTLQLDLPSTELHDIWLPLNTKGSVRVLVWRSAPLDSSLTLKPLHMQLPNFHMQLERLDYLPGETIRGVLVIKLAKPTKRPYQLSIRIEAVSHSEVTISSNEKYKDSHYFMDYEVENITVPGGTPGGPCPAGLHIIPFEVALPLTLPPTFWAEHSTSSGNWFKIFASFGMDGKEPIKVSTTLLIRPSAAFLLAPNADPRIAADGSEPHIPEEPSSSKHKCAVTAIGPLQLVTGQPATYHVKISNDTGTPIDYLEFNLVEHLRAYARDSNGNWQAQVCESNAAFLPSYDGPHSNGRPTHTPHGFPVAAGGGTWEGEITITVPAVEELFTISASVSPLVNRFYRLDIIPKARPDNGPEPAPRLKSKYLQKTEFECEDLDVHVLFPPNSLEIISDNQRGTIGPIYLYLEPFQEAQITDFARIVSPRLPYGLVEYIGNDLSPLFHRAIPPSPSSRCTHWIGPDAQRAQIAGEHWTPGNSPSWLK